MRPLLAILLVSLLASPLRAEQRGEILTAGDARQLPRATTGPAVGHRSASLEPYASIDGPSPAGIAVSAEGRVFISFPGWGDAVQLTVGELTRDRRLIPFPKSSSSELKSVQGIFIDAKNRLWLLDNAARRLFAYDLSNDRRIKDIKFPPHALRGGSYLNDVCVTLALGSGDGVAFISDSAAGAIVVIDLSTGEAWRRLERHASTKADPTVVPVVEGTPLKIQWHCDGIAVSPDGKTVYYTPFTSHSVWSVDAAALADSRRSDDDVATTVKKLTDKPSMNDGITCGPDGSVYTTDEEDYAIRRISPTGKVDLLVQDERLLWLDSVCVAGGYLYTVTNQLDRMAQWHGGKDLRQRPYVIFRLPLNQREGGERSTTARSSRAG